MSHFILWLLLPRSTVSPCGLPLLSPRGHKILSVEYIHKDNEISSIQDAHTHTHIRDTTSRHGPGSCLPQSYSGVARLLGYWHETFGENHGKARAMPRPLKHVQQLSGLQCVCVTDGCNSTSGGALLLFYLSPGRHKNTLFHSTNKPQRVHSLCAHQVFHL